MIIIYAGLKLQQFTVHKDLICYSVAWFRKALIGDFKEGQEGEISLSEDDAKANGLFISWLYRDDLPRYNTQIQLDDLFSLYFFAEKICRSELLNKTMDTIQETYEIHISLFMLLSVIGRVYRNTYPKSKPRKILHGCYGARYFRDCS